MPLGTDEKNEILNQSVDYALEAFLRENERGTAGEETDTYDPKLSTGETLRGVEQAEDEKKYQDFMDMVKRYQSLSDVNAAKEEKLKDAQEARKEHYSSVKSLGKNLLVDSRREREFIALEAEVGENFEDLIAQKNEIFNKFLEIRDEDVVARIYDYFAENKKENSNDEVGLRDKILGHQFTRKFTERKGAKKVIQVFKAKKGIRDLELSGGGKAEPKQEAHMLKNVEFNPEGDNSSANSSELDTAEAKKPTTREDGGSKNVAETDEVDAIAPEVQRKEPVLMKVFGADNARGLSLDGSAVAEDEGAKKVEKKPAEEAIQDVDSAEPDIQDMLSPVTPPETKTTEVKPDPVSVEQPVDDKTAEPEVADKVEPVVENENVEPEIQAVEPADKPKEVTEDIQLSSVSPEVKVGEQAATSESITEVKADPEKVISKDQQPSVEVKSNIPTVVRGDDYKVDQKPTFDPQKALGMLRNILKRKDKNPKTDVFAALDDVAAGRATSTEQAESLKQNG